MARSSNSHGGAAILSADGVKAPLRLDFVHPVAAGYKFLVGVVLDYPQLLSSSTSQRPSWTNLSRWVLCIYFYHFWYCSCSESAWKYTSLKYILFAYCLEALAGVWDDVLWARRHFGWYVPLINKYWTRNTSVFLYSILPKISEDKTLPKAQRTRGLSSSCQSNFLKSYQKFKHKSWSHFIFRISTMHQQKISTKHQHLYKT